MKTNLPLPSTITGTFMAPRTLSYLHNMYNIGGVLLPREGMRQVNGYKYNNGTNPTGATKWKPRGIFSSERSGNVYGIWGDKLYSGFTITDKGSISGEHNVDIAIGFTGIAISSGVNNYFIDDATGTLTEITDVDLPDATGGVAYLNGRYIWSTNDAVYYSDIDDPFTYGSLSFFDSESRPDRNRNVAVIGSDLYVFGSRTIERFRNTGTTAAPFVRVENSVLGIGYVGGLITTTNALYFIGRNETGHIAFYQLTGSTLTVISNDTVNEIFNSDTLLGEFNLTYFVQIVSYQMQAYGRRVLVWTSPQSYPLDIENTKLHDFGFYAIESPDGYQWGFLSDNPENNYADFSEWGMSDYNHFSETFTRRWNFVSCTNSGDGNVMYFQRGGSLDAAGVYAKSDHFRKMGTLHSSSDFTLYHQDTSWDSINADVTEPITKGFRTYLRTEDGSDLSLNSLEVVYSKQGVYRQSSNGNPSGGDSSDTITLRMSKTGVGWGYTISGETEGKDWGTQISESFGDLGDSGCCTFAPSGGLLTNNGYLGIVLESSADIPLTIEQVIIS